MCNCRQLPTVICDPFDTNCVIDYQGIMGNERYLEEPESEKWVPELDWNVDKAKCGICAEKWYLEYASDENLNIIFGVKLSQMGNKSLAAYVAEQREAITILLHGGFEQNDCKISGCLNKCLKGRWLCQKHFSLP